MNLFAAFVDQQVWHIAGWTMLHFLWTGALVGILAIALRVLLRRANANVRYAAALICLALLSALPVAIATRLAALHSLKETANDGFSAPFDSFATQTKVTPPTATETIELTDDAALDQVTAKHLAAESKTSVTPAPIPHPPGPHHKPSTTAQNDNAIFLTFLNACIPYLPWLWIIGTPITFALLAAGIIGTKRLRSASRVTDDPRIAGALARLSSSLRIGRRVTVAICDRIAAPVLIGIVRPIILLPPAALTGWSPDEIEMVLLHELAHVRRWDNLVNLIQRLVESLLFFHPAVWLVSTWVRREREQCCDALVVRRTQRPHAYAELLLNLATPSSQPLAGLAFARHPLCSRIRRILQLEDDPMLISGKSLALTLAALLVAATLAVLYLPTIGQAEEAAEKDTKNTKTNRAENESDSATGKQDPSSPPILVDAKDDAGQKPSGKFPTLEEQKLADQVWKQLGLEIEPIGEDELKRVRALGYDGGLKVVAAPGEGLQRAAFGATQSPSLLQSGDILVGLHVWPTTTLKDVAAVLNRDDLAELNPLKFYVVRQNVDQAPDQAMPQDSVVTGRVTLKQAVQTPIPTLNSWTRSEQPPASSAPVPANSEFDLVVTERVTRDGQKVYETRAVPRTARTASPAPPTAAPTGPPRDPSTAPVPSPPPAVGAPYTSEPSGTKAKSALRYDGKSFDEWRDLWQNELSAAKRAEAVRALAAFARAGYGKEATGVILDVAGNYDFLIISQDAEGKLKQAVIDELAPESGSSDLAKYWLPDLMERLKKDPEKWQFLVSHLLYRLPMKDPNVLATIQSLAESGPPKIRYDALLLLVRKTAAQTPDGAISLNEKARQLLADALSDDDPAKVQAALRLLPQFPGAFDLGGGGKSPPPKLLYLPELVPLLFHNDEPTRQQARDVLQYITDKDSPQVVEQLVAVLKDDARKNDHLHALRALAAMGKKAQPAAPAIAKVFAHSDDKQLSTTALVALTRIAGQSTIKRLPGGETSFDIESLGKALEKLADQLKSLSESDTAAFEKKMQEPDEKEFLPLLLQADQAIFPPTNPQSTGGGGGFF